jgi:hypothetical protein
VYATVTFVLLGAYQFGGSVWAAASAQYAVADLDTMPDSIAPDSIGPWRRASYRFEKRENFDPKWGAASHIFQYTHKDNALLTVQFAVDYPFDTQWHELTGCYQGIGWMMVDRQVIPATTGVNNSEPWNFVTGSFEAVGRFGYLAYSFVDSNGAILSPPANALKERLLARLKRQGPNSIQPRLFQIQTWCENTAPMSDEIRQQTQEALLEFREHVREYIADQVAARNAKSSI